MATALLGALQLAISRLVHLCPPSAIPSRCMVYAAKAANNCVSHTSCGPERAGCFHNVRSWFPCAPLGSFLCLF